MTDCACECHREYLTVDQAAAHLGVNRGRIYRLVHEWRVRHYKLGRLLRFTRDDLDTVMGNERIGHTETTPRYHGSGSIEERVNRSGSVRWDVRWRVDRRARRRTFRTREEAEEFLELIKDRTYRSQLRKVREEVIGSTW